MTISHTHHSADKSAEAQQAERVLSWANEKGVFRKENSFEVPRIGLEPTRLTAPDPKSGVATNYTTWALVRVQR